MSSLTWYEVIALIMAGCLFFSATHREKFVFWARVARKLAFWFCFPWLWNQCETRHFWSFSVVGWWCAEMSWSIGLASVRVCLSCILHLSPDPALTPPCLHFIFSHLSKYYLLFTARNIHLLQGSHPSAMLVSDKTQTSYNGLSLSSSMPLCSENSCFVSKLIIHRVKEVFYDNGTMFSLINYNVYVEQGTGAMRLAIIFNIHSQEANFF